MVLAAAAIHEAGHWLILRLLGADITGLRVSLLGAAMEVDTSRLSYQKELSATLAGPAANLLCAMVLALADSEQWVVFIGANVVLCLFNLLPIRLLDGGRALYLLVKWMTGPETGENVIRCVGTASGIVLAMGLGYVVWQTGGSFWLLPPALGLLAASGRECFGK